jgi:hypothetical protein
MSNTTDLSVYAANGFEAKSIEQVGLVAPAAISDEIHPGLSDRYTKISTLDLLKQLGQLGWEPVSAMQTGKNNYDRHIIRLMNKKSGIVNLKVDDVFAQMIIDNSGNGASPANLNIGLLRKVCGNGLATAVPGMTNNYSFRHVGISESEIRQVVEEAVNNFSLVQERIEIMQDTPLSDKQKVDFALKALLNRDPNLYLTEKGNPSIKIVKDLNDIPQLLEPIRDQDKGDELWKVFNVIQEKLMIGGYKRISGGKRRSTTVRPITNPYRNLAINQNLWAVAETFINEN